ncbi:YlmH/Sll1252 family protein [Exiguobacterium sp. SL14]|nr:YlmH/Sll1252 family protein [Exiguobacterium sp. SL14]MCY1690558.1 YlmH/Sll1252 family protein [Exiguobacterium sp. SL14]
MSVYDHYRGSEREFVDSVLNWIDHVEATYTFKLTDFLNPREQQITQELVGSKCALFFEGGFEGAERKRAILAPDYYEYNADDFDISIYRIHYPTKFVELSHRQVTEYIIERRIETSQIRRRHHPGSSTVCRRRRSRDIH